MLFNSTGSEKSSMAASNTGSTISYFVDMIGTQLQRLYLRFLGPVIQWTVKNVVQHNRTSKFQYGGLQIVVPISQLVDKIKT